MQLALLAVGEDPREQPGEGGPVPGQRPYLVGGNREEGGGGALADLFVHVVEEELQEVGQVDRSQRERPLRGHEAEVARNPALPELLDQGIDDSRLGHRHPPATAAEESPAAVRPWIPA